MTNNYTSILWATTSTGTRLGRNPILFFGLFFCMLFSSINVVGQATVTPSYEWLKAVSFGTITQAETSGLTIAIATDSQGNVYRLTFGDGVLKYNSEGVFLNKIINSSQLNDPLDIALDSNDNIYVIDYEDQAPFTDNGKIRIFNPLGVQTNIILTSYFRPLGLTLDYEDNIYVVIYNDGSGAESTVSSELRVFNNSGTLIKKTEGPSGHTLSEPYRIGVDSRKNIYISHTANDGEVLVLNSSYQYLTTLEGMGSPGSVVIDDEDFIHVIDYSNRIDFGQLLNYKDITFFEALILFNNINAGINNKEFGIRIYDNNQNLQTPYFKDHLELPIDIAFYSCGDRMYVNNSKTNNLSLEIELEIYNRTPSFDTEKPVAVTCPEDQTETLTAISFILPDYRNLATFTDNCDQNLTLVQSPAIGTSITQTTPVTITATDDAGNVSEACAFDVVIENSTDTEKPEITCPSPISQNVDAGQCGAVVTFVDATATDNSGSFSVSLISSLSSGSEFPIGTSTVTFEAKDAAGNTSECSFLITITDKEDPTISCPADISETVANGETGKIITYTAPTFDDNCSGATLKQTDGFASGSRFPLGTTTNIFVVTDTKGNTATCSFDVTITESSDTEKPVINCPDSISENVDPGKCGAVVTFVDATATDNSGSVSVSLISSLSSGSEFPIGTSTVTFEAKDAAGNTSECSFLITITDTEYPTISCPADISETVANGETGKIVTFSAPVFDDNCPGSTLRQTAGMASGSEFPLGATTNTFEVKDTSGNTKTCSFTVSIAESGDSEKPVISCPATISQNVDSGKCGAVVTFADATATDDSGSVSVSLISSLSSGSEFPIGTSTVTFEAKDAAGNTAECSFTITITDKEDPTISCPSNIYETVANGETGKIVTFSAPVFDDNCSGSTINQTAGLTSGSEFPVGTTINTFEVKDASGNTSTCSFNIILTEENQSNTAPIGRDDIFSTLQDVTLNVPASNGVLSNDSDEEGDELAVVLVTDVSSGTLSLNPDGSFTYNPNSGFSGNDFFTYMANDGSQNSSVVTARIEVVAVSNNTVTCKESVTLELDDNGTVSINAEDLFMARPADLQFSINKEIFTCEDIGENNITLSYSNSNLQGSCEVAIVIKDLTAPEIRVKSISVTLNEFGSARITPEMLDDGSFDNCGQPNLSIDKQNFGCKELGENAVTFTATDSSGNVSSQTVIVTITGNCEINPLPGVEYIFIYPNPTNGPFQFATPSGVTIQRVEAFDNRGRLIMFKEFSPADLQYAMDLSGVQNAVYILKLFTSEGETVVRVIIN